MGQGFGFSYYKVITFQKDLVTIVSENSPDFLKMVHLGGIEPVWPPIL